MTPYRHTQIGWQFYAVFIPVMLAIAFGLLGADATMVLPIVLVVLAAVFLFFGWLMVDIDNRRLRIVFGLGLMRRSISLHTIKAFAAVRNPWYYGWGIRLTPHGMLYNVSGFDAVEVLLDDGRRVRVGTDEPEAFVRALAGATGIAPASSADSFPKDPAWWRRVRLLLFGGAAAVVLVVVGQFYVYRLDPAVDVSSGAFSVRSGFYAVEVPIADIQNVALADTLPAIRRRTNGFAARGVLRGNFRLDEWGQGRLFIDRQVPPYVIVRTRDSFVVVNFDDAARTRALYAELQALRPAP